MLILQCNQAFNTDHIKWYDRQRFTLDVETAIFIKIYPGKEKPDGCHFLTVPRKRKMFIRYSLETERGNLYAFDHRKIIDKGVLFDFQCFCPTFCSNRQMNVKLTRTRLRLWYVSSSRSAWNILGLSIIRYKMH